MSNVIHLGGNAAPEVAPTRKRRGPYRKKVTKAEVARAVNTAVELGLTVYGLTFEGDKLHVHTKPIEGATQQAPSEADAWFARHG